MAAAAFYFGFVHRIINIVVFIVGAYIGLNLYPYLFGGSEQRAWASLGLLVSTLLCVLPLIAGIFGIIAKYGKMKYNKTLQPTAPKDGAPVER
jgi:4-hydroxybenzoate polyprenyltransferase